MYHWYAHGISDLAVLLGQAAASDEVFRKSHYLVTFVYGQLPYSLSVIYPESSGSLLRRYGRMHTFGGIYAVRLFVYTRQVFRSRTYTSLSDVLVAVSGENKAGRLFLGFIEKRVRLGQVFEFCGLRVVEYVFEFYSVSAVYFVEIEFLFTACDDYYAFTVLRDSEI